MEHINFPELSQYDQYYYHFQKSMAQFNESFVVQGLDYLANPAIVKKNSNVIDKIIESIEKLKWSSIL